MISLIILVIVTLAGLAGAAMAAAPTESNYGRSEDKWHPVRGAAVLLLVALVWIGFSITTVGANSQSVRTSFGRPTGVIGSGLHLVAPWSSGTTFSAAKQWVRFKGDGNGGEDSSDEPCITVRLARQATACVDGLVSYKQPSAEVQRLFLDWKTESRIRSLLVLQATQQAMTAQLATYDPLANAEQDADALARYSKLVENDLRGRLSMLTDVTVQLTQLDYDDTTEANIRNVQAAIAKTRVAQQDKLTADQIAAANKTISDSLKGDSVTAFYRCVEMLAATLREIKPQTVDLQAVCATAVGVLK
jgi:hypothetical protein